MATLKRKHWVLLVLIAFLFALAVATIILWGSGSFETINQNDITPIDSTENPVLLHEDEKWLICLVKGEEYRLSRDAKIIYAGTLDYVGFERFSILYVGTIYGTSNNPVGAWSGNFFYHADLTKIMLLPDGTRLEFHSADDNNFRFYQLEE